MGHFDGKYLIQNDWLVMESPLSGLLVDIYLNHIEKNINSPIDINIGKNIPTNYGFVDNTILLFDGIYWVRSVTRILKQLLNRINSISQS